MNRLKVSLDTLGTIQPVVWNEKLDCICSGHQRVKAYRSQGVKEIDVWVVNLNEQDHCLAMFMLNNHYGEFDEDMLKTIVGNIQQAEDLDVDALGFDDKHINDFVKELDVSDLQEEKYCSTIIFDDEDQKKEFIKLRKKFKDSGELSDLATERLKQWTE